MLVAVLLGRAAVARGGDVETAKFLFQGGKEDLANRRFAEAVKKLDGAYDEDAGLIEALYWSATACEGNKDTAGAAARYRRFRVACEVEKAAGTATKEEVGLAAKAQARLGALATGLAEYGKILDTHVGELLAFAKANAKRDPFVAAQALRMLLEVRPDHAEANALLRKVEGGDGAEAGARPGAKPADASPFKNVPSWDDLVANQSYGTQTGWTYAEHLLTVDEKGGSVFLAPTQRPPTVVPFAYETELRVTTEYTPDWDVGLAFGELDGAYYSLRVTKSDLMIRDARGDGLGKTVASKRLEPAKPGAWRRIGVLVDGNRIEAWLDGKRVLQHTVRDRERLDGRIGVFQRACRAEFRSLRIGRPG